MMVEWFFLLAAILTEVVATLLMNASGHSRHFRMFLLMWVCICVSYTLLAKALKTIRVGVAVALWEGLGSFLIAVISIVWFQESLTVMKFLGLTLALVGMLLLHADEMRKDP